MSQWHRDHPELMGTDADPYMAHASYRRALHGPDEDRIVPDRDARADLEDEIEALARELGGGWRIEHGVLAQVVLTIDEARRVASRLREINALLDARDADVTLDDAPEA